MNVKPISPNEVKANPVPDEVILVWNMLINKYWDGYSSIVMQRDAVSEIASSLGIQEKEVFANKYLDIDQLYRDVGWKIEYDKPAANEFYPSKFIFKPKEV